MKEEDIDTIITIMMVTYNRLDLTKQTFNTTMKNTGIKYNLIVIDNNSSDDTLSYLKNEIPKNTNISKYSIVSLNKNMGIAYGRNMGLKTHDEKYKTTYLCTLDNDVILPNNWLQKCIKLLMNNSIIGATGVNLEGVNVKYSPSTISEEPVQIVPKTNIGTACFVYRYEYFKKLGYYENYKMYGHEDTLMGHKVRMLGNKQLVYLGENGIHLGTDVNDTGEYKDMKNKYWKINLELFERDIRAISRKQKSLYTLFENYDSSIIC